MRADFLSVSLTVHSRLFARKNRIAVEMPMILTTTTTTIIAIMPPWEMETELPELSPAAPASLPESVLGALSW